MATVKYESSLNKYQVGFKTAFNTSSYYKSAILGLGTLLICTGCVVGINYVTSFMFLILFSSSFV